MGASHDVVIAAAISGVWILFGVWKDFRNAARLEKLERYKFDALQKIDAEKTLQSFDLSVLSMAVEKVPPMLLAQITHMEADALAAATKIEVHRLKLLQCEAENQRLRLMLSSLDEERKNL